MYILESFIDLGLKEGQTFPTEGHRQAAINLAICNPAVFTRDRLTEIVQKVITISNEKLESYTVVDAMNDGIYYRG